MCTDKRRVEANSIIKSFNCMFFYFTIQHQFDTFQSFGDYSRDRGGDLVMIIMYNTDVV